MPMLDQQPRSRSASVFPSNWSSLGARDGIVESLSPSQVANLCSENRNIAEVAAQESVTLVPKW